MVWWSRRRTQARRVSVAILQYQRKVRWAVQGPEPEGGTPGEGRARTTENEECGCNKMLNSQGPGENPTDQEDNRKDE